jgi:hypothetical protein
MKRRSMVETGEEEAVVAEKNQPFFTPHFQYVMLLINTSHT